MPCFWGAVRIISSVSEQVFEALGAILRDITDLIKPV